ncbi:sterol desaturase family protein [Octadecabacter sp. G9-8]|uniref:Sterol desaturase family protein n=1 Tax=Octadecabacter dasysiphoniae TaxID=2909341 RepID=A0ABS9CZI0_9RHOB|nr:sterol desaturase family protein [Octadecabacter dasysiphoniae]MCF2872682.1 sterol desaturase family protein [Octadecabacter dasysiphoniae]
MDLFAQIMNTMFGLTSALSPLYLLACVAIAWAIYTRRKVSEPFVEWLLPRRIWRHKSTRLDLILYGLTVVLSALGIIGRFTVTPAVAAIVAANMPWPPLAGASVSAIMLAFLLWIIGDFATYWVHRMHHTTRALWPLHAVHHSAEVMTPITTYRQHPLAILINASLQTVITGTVLGLLVGALSPDASLVEIAGVNAFNVIAIMALTNFHHSHIWIRYWGPLERIFISPAMHQIHHSTNPAHFNRNYGGFLALWDWMFGTLYLPEKTEQIELGLTSKDDAPLMTHRLSRVLISPLRRMFP